MGRGAERNGSVHAALQVLCSLGVRHGGSSVQRSSVTAHAPWSCWISCENQNPLWKPAILGSLSGIIRAAVHVRARCRLHSWGLTPLCRYGQQEGTWNSCPLPPLGNRWKLSDWKHPLGCQVEETGMAVWLSSVVTQDKVLSSKALNTEPEFIYHETFITLFEQNM